MTTCYTTRLGFWTLVSLLATLPFPLLATEKDAPEVPSPEMHLDRPLGADFHVVDWGNVSKYYRMLAKTCPTVKLQTVGKTSEGRDFLAAIISSPENLASLDAIKASAKVIADPRGKSSQEKEDAINNGRLILFVTPTMHSTELAATEMGMQMAWMLATSSEQPWDAMRREAVVVILPSLNPDGIDHVAQWYRQTVGKPYEGTSLPELYQKYTGHDNNRDYFALTQNESRLLTKMLYHEWHPQILWDVHQQGGVRERFFVPPYRDPLNSNIDPLVVSGINAIGARAAMDMLADGCSGVATGVSYDNWWNGGNRAVPARHNIIGILTEAASANWASPVFLERSDLRDPLGRKSYSLSNQFIAPWPGGWWRQADIIEYELSFAESLLGTLSREPKFWLRNKMAAAIRSSTLNENSKRQAWLITTDNEDLGAVIRLVDLLHLSGIDVHVSDSEFIADQRTYPPGTLVIRCDQPNQNMLNDLFELKEFPDDAKAYDVSGWSLPALFGLRVVEVIQPLGSDIQLDPIAGELPQSFLGDENQESLTPKDSRYWTQVIQELNKLSSKKEVKAANNKDKDSADDRTEDIGNEVKSLPRVGVYAPWSASMDEGWLRWTLDHFQMPHTRVRNEMIRAGKLSEDFDIIVIANISATRIENGRRKGSVETAMTGGLDVEGALAIEEFVRDGGKLIVMDDACPWVVDLLRIPLINVLSEDHADGFYCSGSVVRGIPQSDSLTQGLPATIPLMFGKSRAWRTLTSKEKESEDYADSKITPLLRYASRRLLLSGTIEKPQVIENQIGWVRVEQGQGTIILFGFCPHYRGWSHATFHLLMRSILMDPASES
ncbi:M14 family metallopeptidase [Bremerella alba]|nr:M14 metallopeptidase family protein [Bremerella alba]